MWRPRTAEVSDLLARVSPIKTSSRKFALSRQAAWVPNSRRASSLTSLSRSRSRPLRGRAPTHGQTIARAPGKSRIVMNSGKCTPAQTFVVTKVAAAVFSKIFKSRERDQ